MTRVLVVDDEPQIRRALATNLTTRGYEVDTAATGEEALASARAGVNLQCFFQSFSSSPMPNCVRPMRSVVLP